MKKTFFLIVTLLAGLLSPLLWGMDKPDEVIFPLTLKQYGTQGWQVPDYNPNARSGGEFNPPLVKLVTQEDFRRPLNTFKGDKEQLKGSIKNFGLNTAWYLNLIGRDDAKYYYPLQAVLELGIPKEQYINGL